MYKKFTVSLVVLAVILTVSACAPSASMERSIKDTQSEYGGGLNRSIKVYSYDGKLLETFNGKVDVDSSSTAGKVKFDLNGKRYIFYNAVVAVEEK